MSNTTVINQEKYQNREFNRDFFGYLQSTSDSLVLDQYQHDDNLDNMGNACHIEHSSRDAFICNASPRGMDP